MLKELKRNNSTKAKRLVQLKFPRPISLAASMPHILLVLTRISIYTDLGYSPKSPV